MCQNGTFLPDIFIFISVKWYESNGYYFTFRVPEILFLKRKNITSKMQYLHSIIMEINNKKNFNGYYYVKLIYLFLCLKIKIYSTNITFLFSVIFDFAMICNIVVHAMLLLQKKSIS